MLKPIDNFLNSITMYRVVLYGLIAIVIFAFVLSLLGFLDYSIWALILSFITISITCSAFNIVFAKLFRAVTNVESTAITSLILFLIINPSNSIEGLTVAFGAAVFATASKYIFAFKRKHLFNPAAIALVIIAAFGRGEGSWWVGSAVLLPVVTIVGLLIVRKIRKFSMFLTFLATSSLLILIFAIRDGFEISKAIVEIFASFPIMFFATVMLTEPLTTPPTRKLQIIYALIIGILFGLKYSFGPFYSSPELALVVGNIFSFIVSPKFKPILTLTNKAKIGSDIYEFNFKSDQKLDFTPGQYLEWTLPHQKYDDRGNRRYFTIASSPTETEFKLGVKITDQLPSTFKQKLWSMNKGEKMIAGQLAGDFTLPENKNEKLVFIAGGIGITPFRSMLKYLIDTKEKRDIVLFYTSLTVDNFVYKELITQAEKSINLKAVYVLSNSENLTSDWNGYSGYITETMIKTEVPDFKDRTFYLSGPDSMVKAYQAMLDKLGIPHSKIRTDFFPGF